MQVRTAGGVCMESASNSQAMQSPAANTNTDAGPTCCVRKPPRAPPKNRPKNWKLLYTPMAVPLLPDGAILDTSDGSVASSRLKAMKNRNRAVTTPGKWWMDTAITSVETSNNATAPQNT